MKYLGVEEVLLLHFKIIEDFGGSHGVRDEGRLQSVVSAARQVIFGEEQYKGSHTKAAVYLHNIIGDHPFTDGNKRTGITTAAIFLSRNRVNLTASPRQLEDFAVQVVVEHLDIPTIAEWLKDHSKQG